MRRNAGLNSCTPSPNLLDLLVQGRLFFYLKSSCRIHCVIFVFFGQCLDICVLFSVFVGLLCVVLYCLCNNAYVFTLVFSVKSGHLVLVISSAWCNTEINNIPDFYLSNSCTMCPFFII